MIGTSENHDYEFNDPYWRDAYDRFIRDFGDAKGTLSIIYDDQDQGFRRMTVRLMEIIRSDAKPKEDIEYMHLPDDEMGGIRIDVTAGQAADIAKHIETGTNPREMDWLSLTVWFEPWHWPPVSACAAYCLHSSRDPQVWEEMAQRSQNDGSGEGWRWRRKRRKRP